MDLAKTHELSMIWLNSQTKTNQWITTLRGHSPSDTPLGPGRPQATQEPGHSSNQVSKTYNIRNSSSTVVNLSDCLLTPEQVSVLEKRPKLLPHPSGTKT